MYSSAYMKNKLTETKPKKQPMVLHVSAKCSDMFNAQLVPGVNGESVSEMDGYVPKWFPNPEAEHYGDYVELEIDVATGQILNWKTPTIGDVAETFGKKN